MRCLKFAPICAITLAMIFGCDKYKPPYLDSMPNSVNLGESVIYIDGEEREFEFYFKASKDRKFLTYLFSNQTGDINQDFYLGLPIKEGDFSNKGVFQRLKGDAVVNTYDPVKTADNFFIVDSIDSTSMTIKGHFFILLKKRSNYRDSASDRWPIEFIFQGVFFEKYTTH